MASVRRTVIFRAAQEAIVNARKHAGAEHAWFKLVSANDAVTLVVEDDGVGIDAEAGLSIVTTRERLQALGGRLRVKQRTGGGTTFTAWIPVEEVDGRGS